MPGAFVGWLAEDWASAVLAGHSAIDQRITVPRRWTRSLPQILRLRQQLRASRFDVVLDLQGVRSSVLGALLSGAPRRIGFVGMVSHEFRWIVPNEARLRNLSRVVAGALNFDLVQATSDHIVDRYLEILAPLGVITPQAHFRMPESDEDARGIERLLREMGLADQTYAVINAGGPAFRMWPPDRFAEVARYLGSTHALPSIVLSWHGWELQAAREIVTASGGHARLGPPLSLAQMGSLARRSRLFISGDTGPLHLAAAVGASCVGLIGHALAGWVRPYGSGNILVRGEPVPSHLARYRGLGTSAMRAIGVETVCEAADRMLRGLA
jgi:ADP-heptose:LPS heptosyltransferase